MPVVVLLLAVWLFGWSPVLGVILLCLVVAGLGKLFPWVKP